MAPTSSEPSPASPRRIGVFGGTFDPIHVGHLVAAVNVRHELDLDLVLLVVANEPWQKVGGRRLSPAADRFELVASSVQALQGIEACPMEIERGGLSYTADTISELEVLRPDAELLLVVGADVARQLDTWARVEELRRRVELVVVNRPGTEAIAEGSKAVAGWRVTSVEIPALEISSTDLRNRVACGRPLDFLVPEPAIRVLAERRLYGGPR